MTIKYGFNGCTHYVASICPFKDERCSADCVCFNNSDKPTCLIEEYLKHQLEK